MSPILQILPPELQSAPALISGFLTLLGLVLCTAGIRVARPMAAALIGAAMATLAAFVLPPIAAIDPWIAAIIGLAAGLLLGAVAFRLVQSLLLALCLSLLASSAFFQWQVNLHPLPAQKPVAMALAQNSAAAKVYAKLPANVQSSLQTVYSHWQSIPSTLRQSLLVIALGVAIFAMVVSWAAPRSTTWMMSATFGALFMLWGIFALLNGYFPSMARRIPPQPLPRIVILVSAIALGLLIQRLYFWPKKDRAKDRSGEPASA
jgi:hypothetical protein